MKERDTAAKSLVIIDPMGGAPLQVRGVDDNRIVNLELPKKVKGLVLHRRFLLMLTWEIF